MAAGEAFAQAILRELIRAGTECDFAVFTIGSGGPSWVWLLQRSEAERLQHDTHWRCAIPPGDGDDH